MKEQPTADPKRTAGVAPEGSWSPRKIAIVYGHAASNIGDLAINQGQVGLLRQAWPDAEIHVVYFNAAKSAFLKDAQRSFEAGGRVTSSLYQSHSEMALAYNSDPARFLVDAGIGDADLVVLSAGEHLFHYQHSENLASFYWRTLPALAAKVAGKRCLLMPSTLGPFEKPESVDLATSLLSLVDAWAVREDHSLELVGELLPGARAPEAAMLDPAFFLEPPVRGARREGAAGLVMRSEAWGIRKASAERIEPGKEDPDDSVALAYARAFAEAWLVRDDRSLVVFVQTDADAHLASHLVDLLGDGARVQVARPASVNDYLQALSGLDVVVASRFHAIILACVAGIPGWGCYFDDHGHKMPGLFSLLGVPGRCERIDARNAAEAGARAAAGCAAIVNGETALLERVARLRQATIGWLRAVPDVPLAADRLAFAMRAYGRYSTEIARAGMDAKLRKEKREVRVLREAAVAQAASHQSLQAAFEGVLARAEHASGSLGSCQAELEALRREVEEKEAALARLQQAREEGERRVAEMLAASHKEQLAGMASQLEGARTAMAALTDSHAAEIDRMVAAHKAERKELVDRLQATRSALGKLKQTLKSVEERAANDVWKERNHWTSLLSYRAGNVLVEGLSRPWRWPLLPIALFREWRAYRKDAAGRDEGAATSELAREIHELVSHEVQPPPPRLAGPATTTQPAAARAESGDEYLAMVRSKGAGALADALRRAKPGADGKHLAMELLRLGKQWMEQGEAGIELELARQAMALDESVGVLRGVFWAAQRGGDYALACDAILMIEARIPKEGSQAERKALAQLKGSPAYQLSMLRQVEHDRPRAYEPVARRVCYVLHNSLPYSSGGYATRSHGVAGGLQSQGYEVICITRPGFPSDIKEDLAPESVPAEEVIDGIRYLRIAEPGSKGIQVPDYVSRSADALEARFRELRPELVIAASNYRIGLMAMIAARRLGIPFIYEVRGWWELTRMSRDAEFVKTPSYVVQAMLERAVANGSEHVFTLTEPMREALVAQGADADKVTLLPNSCDPDRFLPAVRDDALASRLGIPDGVPVIGYVGTFVDYEGLEDLAEACGLLARRGQQFRLLMVGNENTSGTDRGPITSQIIEVAEREGFSDWLIMPGRVPHDEVENYYSLIDIAPFPRKPWPVCEMVSPMKPLEALAMEKAVVASDVRALAEMIRDGQTGMLFRKGDVASLADVLGQLMADRDLRDRLGRAGREWVKSERTWNGVGALAARLVSGIADRHG